jgi:Domain of unknown function DUF29
MGCGPLLRRKPHCTTGAANLRAACSSRRMSGPSRGRRAAHRADRMDSKKPGERTAGNPVPPGNPSYPSIHLLKWRYQPERQSDSWRASVSEERQRIEDVLADNPSLRSFPAEALDSAYRLAILDKAIRRLGLLHLPDACPWAIEDVLRDDFWP